MISMEATATTRAEVMLRIPEETVKRVLECPLCGGGEIVDFLRAPDRFHLRRDQYRLLRCSSCSCVWLASPPKPAEMSVHYSEDYHKAIVRGGETSASSRWRGHRELISRHKQGGAILDIGCSSGGFLSTMAGGRWELYGIEMEASTAEKAKQITGAEVFVGDALDAPFPAESFDVITCFDVLEHVYAPRQFLAKVLEWLKPGGILYVRLPNIDSWEAKLLGTYWYGLEIPRHLYHFSPQSLRRLTDSLGFKEISITATESGSHLPNSARYIYEELRRKLGSSPVSLAKTLASSRPSSLPWRFFRKLMQVSFVWPWGKVASAAGAGVFIDAIVAKEPYRSNLASERAGS
jgi:2-polyprenyl-3-methyl-5-hydroxy-6-metoxy-1,4-benzoquinol methylase